MDAAWFPAETHPLLAQLCRHISSARLLGGELSKLDERSLRTMEGLRRFDRLAAMHCRESMAIASLSTKLRLTVQSRFKAERAATLANSSPVGRMPWDNQHK